MNRQELINGYKWGVEYPANGKKPDLPDDVIVDIRIHESDQLSGDRPVSEWLWCGTWSFRIVDERYKPKENKLETDNSWYERGEFPPAGTVCEVLDEGQWCKTKIIGMDGVYCVYVSDWMHEIPYDGTSNIKNFRPIKTERERFVEAAKKCFDSPDTNKVLQSIAEKLYDAGFKAPE